MYRTIKVIFDTRMGISNKNYKRGGGGDLWRLVTRHASNFILGATPLDLEIIG